ncbi:MAG: GntR family transcriptional regulator, partial [Solirubrobacteraceae bacterium]
MSGAKGPVGLLVELDRRSQQQLHEQLEHRIRDSIRDGRLAAGTRLPSSRGLAAELGISRGVVTAVYDQLSAECYLETSQGAPVRVAPGV